MTRSQPRRRLSGRYVLNLVLTALAAAGIGLLLTLAVLSQRQLDAFLAPKPSVPDVSPEDYGMPYENIDLTTSDGLSLAAWFVPPEEPNGASMVLVHGLGGNRSALLPTAEILHRRGFAVLLLDLRAHGESEGEFISYGYLEALDVIAGAEYLVDVRGAEPDRIGLLGVSMGGAAVVRAAGHRPQVGALVLESTLSSLSAGIDDAFEEMSILPRWPFAAIITYLAERRMGVSMEEVDSLRALSELHGMPKLLIHGDQDELLPLDHHLAMVEVSAEPVESWIVAGMGHESPATYAPEAYEKVLIGFLERYLVR